MMNSVQPYPIMLCGDQIDFERRYAGIDPKDRPDWPLPSFDAHDWAEAFCKIATNLGYRDAKGEPIDPEWMVTWFANALMRGYDEREARIAKFVGATVNEVAEKLFDVTVSMKGGLTVPWEGQPIGVKNYHFALARAAVNLCVPEAAP